MKDANNFRFLLNSGKQGEFPLVFVIPGSGQIARYAIKGGAHFLMALNAGVYRTAGVSSLGSFLPFGNANNQTEKLLSTQILPRASQVPVVAGMMPNDPMKPISRRFERMSELGVVGITNWPPVALTDGTFRKVMENEGMTVEAEIEMLAEARKEGFVAVGFVFNSIDASKMAQSGVEVLVLNVGWTRQIHDVFEKADRIELAAVKVNEMLEAIRITNRDPVCLFFGGSVLLPEDSALIYQRTKIHGYGGGSSFERIPVEKLIVDSVRNFRSVPRLPARSPTMVGLGRLIGATPPMTKLYNLIEKVAPYDISVCILGETGSGKELVAAQIHQLSQRRLKPFITLNCGAIPDTLVESEFFGHEKGAFTGAMSRRLGKFELADKGTLFLDEVAELSPKAQVSLLRVLQQKEFSRVGGENAIVVDTRIIAATHQNLKLLAQEGRFRDDLYYRLNMVTLTVPPLRDRIQDIPALVTTFLSNLSLKFNKTVIGVTPEFMSRLMKHSWPGNVRELLHVLSKALLLEDGQILGGEDFTPNIEKQPTEVIQSEGFFFRSTVKSPEANLLLKALETSGGNKSKASRLLGISRKALYSRLKKLSINC